MQGKRDGVACSRGLLGRQRQANGEAQEQFRILILRADELLHERVRHRNVYDDVPNGHAVKLPVITLANTNPLVERRVDGSTYSHVPFLAVYEQAELRLSRYKGVCRSGPRGRRYDTST